MGKNGKINGFYVTIYESPLHSDVSAASTVFVDSVYANGVNSQLSPLFAVFEAAYGQVHPEGTNEDGITEGVPSKAFEDILGRSGEEIDGYNSPLGLNWGEAYSNEEQQHIIAAQQAGKPIVADTSLAPVENFPYTDEDGYRFARIHPRNMNVDIQIPRNHAYAVLEAEERGVTIANPWGHSRDIGENEIEEPIMISWEDFERLFGTVSIGGGYR